MRDEYRESVQVAYSKAVTELQRGCCCGPSSLTGCPDPLSAGQYDPATVAIPQDMLRTSLGCGNPIPAANLKAGETVLDLGCGSGVDILLAALEIRPGIAIGLDVTWEMLELARKHRLEAMIVNVALLQGVIEQLPVASKSIDVVTANGVLTLSPKKETIVREVSRVLKRGGRFVCADAVVRGSWSDDTRRVLEFGAGCVGGALIESDFSECLHTHGFTVSVAQEIRAYDPERFEGMDRVNGQDFPPQRLGRDFLNVVYIAVKHTEPSSA